MTPDELKAVRARLGISQRAMARALNAPRRTYEDWERGISRIPGYLRLALKYLEITHIFTGDPD